MTDTNNVPEGGVPDVLDEPISFPPVEGENLPDDGNDTPNGGV